MGTLDVTPDDLRSVADAFTTAAKDAGGATGQPGSGNSGGAMINGYGKHTPARLSPQLFEPGAKAQDLVVQATSDYTAAAQALVLSCYALSSALHILADAYHAADHEDALKFAFLEPGAARPAGLSPFIDESQTILAQSGSGQKPSGGAGGRGDEAGEAAPQTHTYYLGHGAGRRQVTRTDYFDSDGNLLRSSYVTTYADGRVEYHRAQAGDSPELVFATPAQPAVGAPLAAIERQQAEMEDVLATPDPAGEFYGTYHPRNPKPGEPMTAN